MAGMTTDVFGNVKPLVLYESATLTNATEGTILDVSAYNGVGLLRLRLVEAASTPTADKLDITVHSVNSDSDTLDADNLIATFTQIVGLNGSELAHSEDLPINLDELPILTAAELVTQKAAGVNTVKKYLQVLITNTHAWAASPLIVDLFLGGNRSLPAQALP